MTSNGMKQFLPFRKDTGIGLIDIIVSVGVIMIALLGVSQIAILGTQNVREAHTKEKAIYLAQEGQEVLRFLRDYSWATYIASLNTGQDYYVTRSGSTWVIQSTDPGLIDNKYTRTVRFESVNRDGNDDIATTGTLDPGTREAIVTVDWDTGARSYVLTSYLTDFLSN